MKKKGNLKYYIILSIGFILLVIVQYSAPKPIDWRNSYSEHDKIPYGCFLLKDLMPELFPKKNISISKTPAYNTLGESKNASYVIINSKLEMDQFDTEELLDFVSKGNEVFIAANEFKGKLADTLNIKTKINDFLFTDEKDKQPKINFENKTLKRGTAYQYGNKFLPSHFTQLNSSKSTILSQDTEGNISYVSMRYGAGTFYLNTIPKAFSNYYLTDSLNSDYAYRALSYLNKENIIWDEYYKDGRRIVTTPLRYILSEPSLKIAYFTLLISLILYIIFNVKRKQRIIPVLTPLKNETLSFVNVVGSLYYQQQNHLNIAQKKIRYFLENVRSTYGIKTNKLDDDFKTILAQKSGVTKEVVNDLINTIVKTQNTANEQDLIQLHELIRKFNEQKIR